MNKANSLNEFFKYSCKKSILLRDSILVLPVLIFTVAVLVLKFGYQMDFAPGSNYGASMLYNLILPLAIIGLGCLIYQIILIVDVIKSLQADTATKVLVCVLVWLAVAWTYFLVYFAKIVSSFVVKGKSSDFQIAEGGVTK